MELIYGDNQINEGLMRTLIDFGILYVDDDGVHTIEEGVHKIIG